MSPSYGKTPIHDYRLHLPSGPRTSFDRASEGACRGMDTNLFFPSSGGNQSCVAAKQVCAGCGVRVECLEFALAEREVWGVWGGTSEKERRRIRRERAKGQAA